MQAACPPGIALSVARVALEDLHHVPVHAVAEGFSRTRRGTDGLGAGEGVRGHPVPAAPRRGRSGVGTRTTPLTLLGPSGRGTSTLDTRWLCSRRRTSSGSGTTGRPSPLPASRRHEWDDLVRAGGPCALGASSTRWRCPPGTRGGEATSYCLLGLLATNGVGVFREGRVSISSQGTAECLTMLAELAAAGILGADAVGYDRGRAIQLLAQGGSRVRHRWKLRASPSWPPRPGHRSIGCGVGSASSPRPRDRGRVRTPWPGAWFHVVFRQAANPHGAALLLRAFPRPTRWRRCPRAPGSSPRDARQPGTAPRFEVSRGHRGHCSRGRPYAPPRRRTRGSRRSCSRWLSRSSSAASARRQLPPISLN